MNRSYMRYGFNVLSAHKTARHFRSEAEEFDSSDKRDRTRTRSVCVPHPDGFGTKRNQCHTHLRPSHASKGGWILVKPGPVVKKLI